MLTYEDLTIFNLIIYWTLQIITKWYANSFYINKYSYSSILFSLSLSIILFLFDTIVPHRPSNGIAILRHDADGRMTGIVFFGRLRIPFTLYIYQLRWPVRICIFIFALRIHTPGHRVFELEGLWTIFFSLFANYRFILLV